MDNESGNSIKNLIYQRSKKVVIKCNQNNLEEVESYNFKQGFLDLLTMLKSEKHIKNIIDI